MEINRLTSDELSYELTIRATPVDGTVHEKRRALREAIREGRVPLFTDLDPMLELNTCNQKLINLRDELANFDFSNKENENQRIYSRLIHVNRRLSRVMEVNEEQKQIKNNLLSYSQQLLEDLKTTMELPPPRVNIQDSPLELTSSQLSQSVLNESNLSLGPANIVAIPSLSHDNINLIELQPVVTCQSNNSVILSQPNLISSSSSIPSTLANTQSRVPLSHTMPCTYSFSQIRPVSSAHSIETSRPISSVIYDRHRHIYPDVQTVTSHQSVSRHYDQQMDAQPITYRPINSLRHSTENLANQIQNFQPFENVFPNLTPTRNLSYVNNFDISKWRISFDGQSSITTFLEDVEELRVSRGLSKEQLFKSAAELFVGNAKSWYRFAANYVSTWDELVAELKASFQHSYYDRDLLDEIKKRSQGADERVVIYIAKIENLFSKLSRKPLESERVQIIRGLLLPNIQRRLPLSQINSIRDLVELSRMIEEDEKHVELFVPPPPYTCKALLEPQLAYQPPYNTRVKHVHVVEQNFVENPVEDSTLPKSNIDVNVIATSNRPASNNNSFSSRPPTSSNSNINTNVDQPTTSQSNRNNVTCWNCNQSGHYRNHCTQPRKVVCYRCGKDGVTVRNCPVCSENIRRGR